MPKVKPIILKLLYVPKTLQPAAISSLCIIGLLIVTDRTCMLVLHILGGNVLYCSIDEAPLLTINSDNPTPVHGAVRRYLKQKRNLKEIKYGKVI